LPHDNYSVTKLWNILTIAIFEIFKFFPPCAVRGLAGFVCNAIRKTPYTEQNLLM